MILQGLHGSKRLHRTAAAQSIRWIAAIRVLFEMLAYSVNIPEWQLLRMDSRSRFSRCVYIYISTHYVTVMEILHLKSGFLAGVWLPWALLRRLSLKNPKYLCSAKQVFFSRNES